MSITIRRALGGVLAVLAVVSVSVAGREEGVRSQASTSSPDTTAAQAPASPRPEDIYPGSRNRLPLVERESLDELGKALFES